MGWETGSNTNLVSLLNFTSFSQVNLKQYNGGTCSRPAA